MKYRSRYLFFNMKLSKMMTVLSFIVFAAVCVESRLTAKINCYDECLEGDFGLAEDLVCASNGFYTRWFATRCHLNQHNVCFQTSEKLLFTLKVNFSL